MLRRLWIFAVLYDEFMRGAVDGGNDAEKIRVAAKKIAPLHRLLLLRRARRHHIGGVYEAGEVRDTQAMADAYNMGKNV